MSLILLVATFPPSIFRVIQVHSSGCSSRSCTGTMKLISFESVWVRLRLCPLFAVFEPLLRPCTENAAARAIRKLSGILCLKRTSTVRSSLAVITV